MANGLNIRISEDDFKKKSSADQNWMTFKAIENIDVYGCKHGRTLHNDGKIKTLWMVGAGIGGGLGFALTLLKFLSK